MTTSIELQDRCTWQLPVPPPLDEAVWGAWVAKGRAEDERSAATRVRAMKWFSIAALIAAAAPWSHSALYEAAVRFTVLAGAVAVMLQALQLRHYAFAAVFGALAVVYNPVAPVFSFSGHWLPRIAVFASALPFIGSLAWSNVRLAHSDSVGMLSRSSRVLILVFGTAWTVASAADLSRYREFQLGTNLEVVAKQTGARPSQAEVLHSRPALIQELTWRPQPLAWSSKTEPVQEVFFTFYRDRLFRIVVNYDRYETEGLTADDMVEAISAAYGTAADRPAPGAAVPGRFDDEDEVLARWLDPQFRFDLIRSSYGSSFRLVGVEKTVEASAQMAIQEAKRLDDQEAPQREAARIAGEEKAARAKLEKARLVNKPKFRP